MKVYTLRSYMCRISSSSFDSCWHDNVIHESAPNGRRLGDEARKSPSQGRFKDSENQPKTRPHAGGTTNGEGGTRTHDTTIFSRVLYQLSYLAWDCAAVAALREG